MGVNATGWWRMPLFNRLKSGSHWRHSQKPMQSVNATLFEKQNRSLKMRLKTLTAGIILDYLKWALKVITISLEKRKTKKHTQWRWGRSQGVATSSGVLAWPWDTAGGRLCLGTFRRAITLGDFGLMIVYRAASAPFFGHLSNQHHNLASKSESWVASLTTKVANSVIASCMEYWGAPTTMQRHS